MFANLFTVHYNIGDYDFAVENLVTMLLRGGYRNDTAVMFYKSSIEDIKRDGNVKFTNAGVKKIEEKMKMIEAQFDFSELRTIIYARI